MVVMFIHWFHAHHHWVFITSVQPNIITPTLLYIYYLLFLLDFKIRIFLLVCFLSLSLFRYYYSLTSDFMIVGWYFWDGKWENKFEQINVWIEKFCTSISLFNGWKWIEEAGNIFHLHFPRCSVDYCYCYCSETIVCVCLCILCSISICICVRILYSILYYK